MQELKGLKASAYTKLRALVKPKDLIAAKTPLLFVFKSSATSFRIPLITINLYLCPEACECLLLLLKFKDKKRDGVHIKKKYIIPTLPLNKNTREFTWLSVFLNTFSFLSEWSLRLRRRSWWRRTEKTRALMKVKAIYRKSVKNERGPTR